MTLISLCWVGLASDIVYFIYSIFTDFSFCAGLVPPLKLVLALIVTVILLNKLDNIAFEMPPLRFNVFLWHFETFV